jgi:hypothetical protein
MSVSHKDLRVQSHRVENLVRGFKSGLGFRDEGLGFRVWGSEFRGHTITCLGLGFYSGV